MEFSFKFSCGMRRRKVVFSLDDIGGRAVNDARSVKYKSDDVVGRKEESEKTEGVKATLYRHWMSE